MADTISLTAAAAPKLRQSSRYARSATPAMGASMAVLGMETLPNEKI
ncbi:MAG: hypothetical protein ACLT2C_03215 [Ruminococcus sp.]